MRISIRLFIPQGKATYIPKKGGGISVWDLSKNLTNFFKKQSLDPKRVI